jgi:hypothetical protein
MSHTNDPNAPSPKEFAEDWLSRYRDASLLNIYDHGELDCRLATLKLIEPGEVILKNEFAKRVMKCPLIHNDLVLMYLNGRQPKNDQLFRTFMQDQAKLTHDQFISVMAMVTKEFVDFVFCEVSQGIWRGLNCTKESIWKKPGKEWLLPHQELMAWRARFDYDTNRLIKNEFNANEVVDFVYRKHCFDIGDDYQPALAAEVASTANEIARTSIGEQFDDVVAEKGIVTNGFAYTVLVKSTELVIAAIQTRLTQELARVHG